VTFVTVVFFIINDNYYYDLESEETVNKIVSIDMITFYESVD
jgi:hypothetical protein